MSGSRNLETHHGEDATHDRELYLRDGRKLVVSEQGLDQLVEIRSESGMVELRIRLTEQGPVLQMESVRLELKATEAVTIDSKRVEIKGSDSVEVQGGEVKVEAKGENHVIGRPIHLNRDV